ncbi:indolepyruvate ferredoxin oxidoreductase family protein [Cupriavidus oxalaticus]|uniref:Indolepyruvate ferredoxin oxidoreductase n=2 Tax=Cupriavidus oxalaticus TaxID=96344 RepID=A0A375GJX4_9BURK|nr:indolepyruvate ferredoxin oxidoreductase family protein [Cupriavidus oxalaticus]QRQ83848.1 indolepyruvate ferredoxin oxidoreductase family protein [Cupriavidus oxalaticus]QRQ92063.1 indolepyruvate ferredoxin oxidoreductase family protein [Cupriavidus oxalaticus]WQD86661.1 indolepyruvate ferredoxin oxidoreductase family protein [Cupriavidus oxalaticus]SPC19334.1 Indolepyruvate ferredoxin oxidoreductase [Cupriavidus oxalaticus]
MNAPLPHTLLDTLASASLDDKYTLDKGRVYMSGVQALVRLPMLQKARDRAAGLNTAGFISGYRGSPLGGVDQALWKAKKHLADNDVVFQPGVNEDLAATAVWGSQQVNLFPNASRDGVFSMWYGKGPGVDRSIDVLKHANSAGSSRHGGVLLLAGDDHAAKSSTVAHQSEHVLQAAGIPVLYPANVQEYLDYGLHGWAMSRYSGLWVSMKCVTDVVESTASVEIDPDRVQVVLPQDFAMPAGGLNIRWPDTPLEQEARLLDHKWYAALAYVRANRLNRVVLDSPNARFGIMTAGKAYLDVRQALADLGLDDETCARIGIRVYKVGCVWPLEAHGAREFATGLEEILVVEEKRQILEYALKEELYNWREDVRPKVFGKFDQRGNDGGEWSVPRGNWLLPAHYELSPALIAKAIARRLERFDLPEAVRARIAARVAVIEAKEREAAQPRISAERKPWFCSGCPHNTSTRVPEGSRALAGIGCHYMTLWMDRNTDTFSQMGGEGVAWTGQMHFTGDKHVFANLGDGTYFHSGLLAIRASIAAKANITYKILFNDAVAMTGGQPIDGVLTVPQIAHQVLAEGAKKLVVVTDEPQKYGDGGMLPSGVTVFHRDQLDAVQLELRDTEGVTILIYDQTCATEKRRRRKRGTYPDPAKRAFINDAVCEGCGDCSAKSNCLSVEPLETELGTKRRINQSSCNKDFSCVNGFCPSFVTAEGAQVRKPAAAGGKGAGADFEALPMPALPALERPYGVLVTGVGGTGVVTIGGLLGMAAHLERKGVTVLDMAGLAQKGGAVISHVQIAPAPHDLHATRIATGDARLVIGGDAIVSASAEVLSKTRHGVTAAVVNSANTPTAEFIKNPKWRFPGASAEQDLRNSVGEASAFIDASAWAVTLLADAIYSNPLLLGFAWQKGWIPLQHASLLRAIELNGVSVDKNRQAFEWGRYLAHHGEAAVKALLPDAPAQTAHVVALPQTLDTLIRKREAMLTDYQNAAYAQRYREAVERIRAAEQKLGADRKLPLTEAVARNLAKLMAYKDEYEVARLYADPAFLDKLRAQFEGEPGRDYQLNFWLAPPTLGNAGKTDSKGHPVKRRFGPRTLTAFRLLARLKGLRGTAFDVFGKTAERRAERALVADYLAMVDEFAASLGADKLDTALALAALPDDIRGYGHVKEAGMQAAAERREALLAQYRGTARRAAA